MVPSLAQNIIVRQICIKPVVKVAAAISDLMRLIYPLAGLSILVLSREFYSNCKNQLILEPSVMGEFQSLMETFNKAVDEYGINDVTYSNILRISIGDLI